MNNLNKLNVNFKGCNDVDDAEIRNMNLKKFKSLEELKVNFSGCKELTSECLKHLNLDKIPQIKSFELVLSGCQFKLDKGFGFIFNNKMVNITQLSLDFSNCNQIYEKNLKSFNISKFKLLERLKMNFANCEKLNNQALRCILHSSIPSLKHLDLNISGCQQVSSRNFKYFNNIRTLNSLKLDLSNCSGINKLFRVINFGLMDMLKDLWINIESSGIDEKDFSSLSHLELKHLTNVYIQVGGNNFSRTSLLKVLELKSQLNKYLDLEYQGFPNVAENKKTLTHVELASVTKAIANLMVGYRIRKDDYKHYNLIKGLDI